MLNESNTVIPTYMVWHNVYILFLIVRLCSVRLSSLKLCFELWVSVGRYQSASFQSSLVPKGVQKWNKVSPKHAVILWVPVWAASVWYRSLVLIVISGLIVITLVPKVKYAMTLKIITILRILNISTYNDVPQVFVRIYIFLLACFSRIST